MRSRWIQDPKTNKFIPEEEYYADREACAAPMVIGDIEPYRNVVDRKLITSRSHHRAFLRQHELIEVGNERMEPRKPTAVPGLKEDIRRAMGD
jgi:hypothetical protein